MTPNDLENIVFIVFIVHLKLLGFQDFVFLLTKFSSSQQVATTFTVKPLYAHALWAFEGWLRNFPVSLRNYGFQAVVKDRQE